MKKNKIYTVLSQLNDKEIKEFGLFIESPFFNKSQILAQLYKYISKFHPTYSHKQLEESLIIKHLDLKQSNVHSALAKLYTQLFKLFELYIPISCMTDFEQDKKMLEFYSNNRLNNLFSNSWSSISKKRGKIDARGHEYYYEDFSLQTIYSDYISSRAEKGEGDNNLKERSKALDRLYFINKLTNACLQKNRQRSAKVDFEYTLLDEVRTQIDNQGLLDDPSFALWYKTLHLLENPDDRTTYNEIKSMLLNDHSKVDSLEVKNLYVYLINTTRNLFGQTDDYFSELFSIHRNQYESGYLHHKDYIGASNLINFVSISSHIGEFDYVEKFLKDNKNSIAPEYQEHEDVYELAQAIIAYYKKDYEKLLDLLNEIKCVNIYRKLRERRLRLVAYYEAELNGLFDDLINSTRKYLSVNKENIPDFHLQVNKDFINVAQNLTKITKGANGKIKSLSDEISEIKTLPLRGWFVEKLEEKS